MKIQDSIVLVTGSSSGMGAATAKAMARKGARVVLLARTPDKLEQVVREIVAQGGQAQAFPVDLTDASSVERVAATIREKVGLPDVIVNIAGAGRWLFVEETSPEEAVQMMASPYFAAFFVTRAFLPHMIQRKSGRIVNMTSLIAHFVWPGAAGYCAARWAMRGFSNALRVDLHGTGVGVTLIAAGKVQTPYFEANPGSEERIPGVDRFFPTLTPEQVADNIVWAVERNKREVVIPRLHRMTVLLNKFAPRLVEWLTIKTGWKRTAAG